MPGETLQQEKRDSGQERFLEVLSEQQALAAGVNLGEKHLHAVFRRIQQLSTQASMRDGQAFTIEPVVLDGIGSITRKDLAAVLKRLTRERVVVQILAFEFENDLLALRPAFIARPVDRPDSLRQLYQECVNRSAKAVELFIARQAASLADFTQELQNDLAGSAQPSSPRGFINLAQTANLRLLDVMPDREMVDAVLRDIERDLVERGSVVPVPPWGLFQAVKINVVERFETAADFMIDRVIPRYRMRGNCRKELAQIAQEEAVYHLDEFAAQSADFRRRRAEEVRKVALETAEGGRYPGALAVECVIALSSIVREKYNEAWRAESDEAVAAVKRRLTTAAGTWQEQIGFFDQKEITKMNPSTWNRLVGDEALLYGVWELPRTTMHILVRRKSSAFRYIITGMMSQSVPEWQVLAIKDLIENYEDYFRDLFADRDFVQLYGRLLRRAYIPHMPWYLRILLWLSIKPLQDMAFQSAKAEIIRHQSYLERVNHERYLELLKQKEEERFRKSVQIKKMALANRILDRMDECYFRLNVIPTIGEIRHEFPDISDEDFEDVLRTSRFQILAAERGERKEDRMVLYPMDNDWKAKSEQLQKSLESMEKSLDQAGLDERKKRQLDRLRRVRKAAETAGQGRPRGGEGDDPYQRLEKEIRKYRETRKSNAAAVLPFERKLED